MKTDNITKINFNGTSGLTAFRINDGNGVPALSTLSFRLNNINGNDFDKFTKMMPEIAETKGIVTILNLSGVSAENRSPVNVLKVNGETIIAEENYVTKVPYKKSNPMLLLEDLSKLLVQIYNDIISVNSPIKVFTDYHSAGNTISTMSFDHSERIRNLTNLFIEDYRENGIAVDKAVVKHTIGFIDKMVRQYIL